MITYTKGNLLDADVEVLVNAVNTVGIMGKGIALMFKQQFPKNMKEYVAACKAGQVQTGYMFATQTDAIIGAKWIVNFPTKKHWRNPSQMIWIEEGLQDLRRFIIENNIKSIAIPALGTGLGGLSWQDVNACIIESLQDLNQVNIIIYTPFD